MKPTILRKDALKVIENASNAVFVSAVVFLGNRYKLGLVNFLFQTKMPDRILNDFTVIKIVRGTLISNFWKPDRLLFYSGTFLMAE